MNKRPTSLTVIAWLLIVAGVISFINIFVVWSQQSAQVKEMMKSSPMLFHLKFMLSNYIAILVLWISGIGILKRYNWARFLYAIYGIISLIRSIIYFTSKPLTLKIIPIVIIFLIVVFFLFRPKANNYFAGKELTNGAG
jgi:preprotein translocase subunit YajC